MLFKITNCDYSSEKPKISTLRHVACFHIKLYQDYLRKLASLGGDNVELKNNIALYNKNQHWQLETEALT